MVHRESSAGAKRVIISEDGGPIMREQYILRELRDGRWAVWDWVHQRQHGPGRTLEEADRAVEELNAEPE